MRASFSVDISSNRKPNGFRTFYASICVYLRLWVQRWDVTGRPNWTCGLAPRPGGKEVGE